jgi:hypothetical protein
MSKDEWAEMPTAEQAEMIAINRLDSWLEAMTGHEALEESKRKKPGQ